MGKTVPELDKGEKTWGSCKFSLEASKEIGMSEIPKKGPQNE
jgi:hypothetical protein